MLLKENKLLDKKDFINKFVEPHHKNEFKKMRIKDLRELYGVTHLINGKFEDMRGNCFKCLKPLRPDYTQYENWCLDC